MIRSATLEDIPRMVEMGRRFRKESSYNKYLTDNPKCMAELAKTLISKNGLIVSERGTLIVGMLGFIIYEHFISGDLLVGEICWWTEPEFRGEGTKLLIEMKERARKAGAKFYQMIAPNEKIGRFYEHLGCELVESTYQGIL